MFKRFSLLAGGAAGIYLAVATGAPPPSVLISHVTARAAQIFQVGLRTRLPFRAFVLRGPGRDSRLVVDVGHRR
jgi:hypothetical protein